MRRVLSLISRPSLKRSNLLLPPIFRLPMAAPRPLPDLAPAWFGAPDTLFLRRTTRNATIAASATASNTPMTTPAIWPPLSPCFPLLWGALLQCKQNFCSSSLEYVSLVHSGIPGRFSLFSLERAECCLTTAACMLIASSRGGLLADGPLQKPPTVCQDTQVTRINAANIEHAIVDQTNFLSAA
jgi:hypothetical protein